METTRHTRTLSDLEIQWIEDCRDRIEGTTYVIQDLASMLITIGEMMGNTSIDPHYRKELGTKGVLSIGCAIDKLTEKITNHHEDIQDVLEGVAEAEHKAREDYLSTRWKRSRP